ncbi:MAG: hypothetical protein J6X89_06435 [Bacteroidales bacterium]|nr:hypothetical protein [Bacteroidales bacterium]
MKKIFVLLMSVALIAAAGCSKKHSGGSAWDAAVNLSNAGHANCYIVSAPGLYCFDATVIGNGQQGIIPGAQFHTESTTIAPSAAKILSNDGCVSDVCFDGSKVYFRAGDQLGNAQVAVYDAAGEVLWSWHIWRTDAPKEITHTNRDKISWTVMDRNLGATATSGDAANGLYYQWGRKDPFTAKQVLKKMYFNEEKSLAYAVKYPTRPLLLVAGRDVYDAFDWYVVSKDETNHYLWGNPDFAFCHPLKDMVKTIYDPCPAGYLVAPSNTFIDFQVPEKLEFLSDGFTFAADNGEKEYFPYAGGFYTGAVDRSEPSGPYCALWNSCSARFIYWDDGGCRTQVDGTTREARLYYGDLRPRCYPVRCVKQAE